MPPLVSNFGTWPLKSPESMVWTARDQEARELRSAKGGEAVHQAAYHILEDRQVLDDARHVEVDRALEAGEMGAARYLFADKELEAGKEEEPPGDWELGDRSAENRQV